MPNRTLALCVVLGWQGGTIHQVAQETGCDVSQLLHEGASDEKMGTDFCKGWFAARTCSLKYNRENVFPGKKGNLDFWIGAAEGMRHKLSGQ